MKLTLAEIDRELKEIKTARDGLDRAADGLRIERQRLLAVRKPVSIAVARSMNGQSNARS